MVNLSVIPLIFVILIKTFYNNNSNISIIETRYCQVMATITNGILKI